MKKNKPDAIEKINKYALEGEQQAFIKIVNELISSNEIDATTLGIAIVSHQLFGFNVYNHQALNPLAFQDSERISILQNLHRGRQFKFLNREQLNFLQNLNLNHKTIISAPTSFGKTSLANEYIIQNSVTINNVIYIVPTNALIEELYEKFLTLNKIFHLQRQISTLPKIIPNTKSVLLLTPERFLILQPHYKLKNDDIVIMDEFNKIMGEPTSNDTVDDRPARFRRVAELVAKSLAKSVFLSPYTYESDKSIIEFSNKYKISIINYETEYVNHEIHEARNSSTIKKTFNYSKFKVKSDKIEDKVYAILQSLRGEQTIIYTSSVSILEKVLERYKTEYNDLNILDNSTNYRLNSFAKHLIKNYSAQGVSEWKVIQALKLGIGLHIAAMPRYVKKEIVSFFNQGLLHTMIVTTSFVEGVNTTAKNIIITSSSAGKRKLNEIDILNIIGRAGRFGKSPIGKVFTVTKQVQEEVIKAKSSRNILTNSNYKTTTGVRPDYDLETIEKKYLNSKEQERINFIHRQQNETDLVDSDFIFSQNTPKSWQISIYRQLQAAQTKRLKKLQEAVEYILSDSSIDSTISGLTEIFNFLHCINILSTEQPINILQQKPGEIQPYSGNFFLWGSMYKRYIKMPINQNIAYRKRVLEQRLSKMTELYPIIKIPADARKTEFSWLIPFLNYNLTINDEKIYEEIFKFISTVVEYKLPLYVTLFIETLQIYLKKNDANSQYAKLLQKSSSPLLANSQDTLQDNQRQSLIDYGIPQETIHKIINNNVKIEISTNVDEIKNLDNFEKILIKDFINNTIV